jgi:hypothetical protein
VAQGVEQGQGPRRRAGAAAALGARRLVLFAAAVVVQVYGENLLVAG